MQYWSEKNKHVLFVCRPEGPDKETSHSVLSTALYVLPYTEPVFVTPPHADNIDICTAVTGNAQKVQIKLLSPESFHSNVYKLYLVS